MTKLKYTDIPAYDPTDYSTWLFNFSTWLPNNLSTMFDDNYEIDPLPPKEPFPRDIKATELKDIQQYTKVYAVRSAALYKFLVMSISHATSGKTLATSLVQKNRGNGVDAMAALENLHLNPSAQSKLSAIQTLLTLSQGSRNPQETVSEFKVRVEQAHQRIDALNVEISDLVSLLFLQGLAPHLRSVVDTILV